MTLTDADGNELIVNDTTVLPVVVPSMVVCPTCGASRGGASGAPHGCSTVAVMPSKSGTGIVYAPTSRYCDQCGSKEHRNLSANERQIICFWQQFTAETYPGAFEHTDRNGAVTKFADIDATKAGAFAAWLAGGGGKVKARKVRTLKPKTPAVTVDPTIATPMASSIAQDITEDPPEVHAPAKPKRMTKAERAAALAAEIARQEREEE